MKARRAGAAILLITHNLAVVAETCDRVAVMYGGKIQEVAPVTELFAQSAASVHAGTARLDPAASMAPKARAPHGDSRDRCPTSISLPVGLQVRDALSEPLRAVRRHRAAAHRRWRRTTGALPPVSTLMH